MGENRFGSWRRMNQRRPASAGRQSMNGYKLLRVQAQSVTLESSSGQTEIMFYNAMSKLDEIHPGQRPAARRARRRRTIHQLWSQWGGAGCNYGYLSQSSGAQAAAPQADNRAPPGKKGSCKRHSGHVDGRQTSATGGQTVKSQSNAGGCCLYAIISRSYCIVLIAAAAFPAAAPASGGQSASAKGPNRVEKRCPGFRSVFPLRPVSASPQDGRNRRRKKATEMTSVKTCTARDFTRVVISLGGPVKYQFPGLTVPIASTSILVMRISIAPCWASR